MIHNHLKPLIYVSIILLSCLFTAGLNVLHSKFILGMNPAPVTFTVPVFAGIIFGLLIAHINSLSHKLSLMAYTDSLTHIYNRMFINDYLDTEIDKARRYDGLFSLIFFDIDHFKEVNDRYGHQTGDDVLRSIAKIVNEANRSSDIFARYGGEEFIIFAASTDLEGATLHAERLRSDIERYPFIPGQHVTCSFGVVQYRPESDDLSSLIKRVDMAMYQAKHEGRNKVVAAA